VQAALKNNEISVYRASFLEKTVARIWVHSEWARNEFKAVAGKM
jgi:hypothetical protein